MSADLSFATLRNANVQRLPQFKNKHGEPAHSEPDGSDWSLGEWSNAVMGELGEAANLIKKIQRGDTTLHEARADLADEFADVAIYLDLLAFRAGIDLGTAVQSKWNRTSVRVECPLRILFNRVAVHPDTLNRDDLGAMFRDEYEQAAGDVEATRLDNAEHNALWRPGDE